jgi:hypothetical protein
VIRFPDCFVLIFGELALGGFLCLSVPPFHEIERGFYKSSATVFLTAALAMIGAKLALLVRAAPPWPPLALAETAAWALFATAAAVYLYSLWGDPYRLRASAYLATLGSGLLALTLSALRVAPPSVPVSLALALYPISFAMSAAVLGTAVTGMLLGHWYLIDTGMSLRPLERVLRAFVGALACQLAVIALGLVVAFATAFPDSDAALWRTHGLALVARLALGPGAALVIAALIARTLAIPQTMAATGLFYIAVLAVTVGEMLSRLLLLRTSLPL